MAQAESREHGLEVYLPVLQRTLAPGCSLLPVMVGGMSDGEYARAAELLRPLADEGTLVVVSSDFTHYGGRFGCQPLPPDDKIAERLAALDQGAFDAIAAGDGTGFLKYFHDTGITVCGYGPIAILLNLMKEPFWVEKAAYRTSGALTGDYKNSVSYLAAAVTALAPFSAAPAAKAAPAAPAEAAIGEPQLHLLHRIAALGAPQGADPQGYRPEELACIEGELPDPLNQGMGGFVILKK